MSFIFKRRSSLGGGVNLEKKIPARLVLPPNACTKPVKIKDSDDLTKYLQLCSQLQPIAEGYVCKDVRKQRATFEKFRKRYFVLYQGLLVYYNHKSEYTRDKKNGLVNFFL